MIGMLFIRKEKSIVLLPVEWESHSSPEMGEDHKKS